MRGQPRWRRRVRISHDPVLTHKALGIERPQQQPTRVLDQLLDALDPPDKLVIFLACALGRAIGILRPSLRGFGATTLTLRIMPSVVALRLEDRVRLPRVDDLRRAEDGEGDADKRCRSAHDRPNALSVHANPLTYEESRVRRDLRCRCARTMPDGCGPSRIHSRGAAVGMTACPLQRKPTLKRGSCTRVVRVLRSPIWRDFS